MSTTTTIHFSSLLALYLLLLLCVNSSLHTAMGGRIIPPSAPSTVTRPLVSSSSSEEDGEIYVKARLDRNKKEKVYYHGREVKNCLPKGFRHSSAPSRFVNYRTLSSGGCNNNGMHNSHKP